MVGCLCFAANIGILDKFDSRARKCILLGYTFGFKGYKLFDLATKQVFHSRDVVFSETVFPFKQTQDVSTLDTLSPVHVLPFCTPSPAALDPTPSPLLQSYPLSSLGPFFPSTHADPVNSSHL